MSGIEEAVAAEIGVEGAVVVGWVLVAAYRTPEMDDATGYYHGVTPGLPYHHSLGLLHHGLIALQGRNGP